MKQILIVEDDSFLNKMLDYNLTADGYGVTSALNARTAADVLRQREFDLVLLDINLPDGNGFELCKLIKPQHPDTIVIFLTANDQESDQIRGYEVGAVDYITKPFVIGALQRKIKAMFAMLEHHKPAKDIYDDGRLFLDFSEQTASLNGKPLTLSPMEYKMLNLFRKNPRQMTTRPSQRPSFLSRMVPSPLLRFLPMVSTPRRKCLSENLPPLPRLVSAYRRWYECRCPA